MLFEIRHEMHFSYSRSVFIEPMVLRLQPRSDAAQRLQAFSLKIDPLPQGITACVDLDGTSSHALWFSGENTGLTIVTTAQVKPLRINLFDFVLAGRPKSGPLMSYAADLQAPLHAYLTAGDVDETVTALATEVASISPDALTFLMNLCARVPAICRVIYRELGDPWAAAYTLAQGQGSCRDLTVLFMDACRAQGFAARFVSGYNAWDAGDAERDLHAWAEVYLPGAGWRAFDPSSGLAADYHYIALAAAANPLHASPTQGSFRGTGVVSTLRNHIAIRSIETATADV